MPSILFATVLALSALYVPQPLLPVLSREFGITRETAALLTTIAFLPLSVAPLFYGLLLETMSAKRILRWAIFLLALSELMVPLTTSFNGLMALRLVQGLMIPAMLTALMTCTSRMAPAGEIPRAMSWYIAATIVGGFSGRFVSGMIASTLNWRYSFLVLGVSLLVAWAWVGRLPESGHLKLQKPSLRMIGTLFADPVLKTGFAMVFCFFLVFAAMMNYLPFRLTELSPLANEFRIGAAYVGYLFGVLVSLNAVRLQNRIGGAGRVMVAALAVYVFALLIMTLPSIAALIGGMFLLCGAMFLTHSTAAGFLNRHAGERQAVANGMYVAFYYGGGAAGSYLPGFVYRDHGWAAFMIVLVLVAVGSLSLAVRLLRTAS